MRKRATAVVGVFALVLSVALLLSEGTAAFAASQDKRVEAEQTASKGVQDHRVLICHKGRVTITIDSHALKAHEAHGDDTAGPCQTEPTEPTEPATELTTEPTSTPGTQNEGQKKDAVNSTESVKTCDGKSIELKSEEKRVLDLHNKTRKHYGLKPLCVDPKLTRAARSHSQEMIDKDYFRHESYNGEAFDARLRRFGYDWFASGENVAWGTSSYGTAEGTFERWMESPGHKQNILDEKFKEVGIGLASGEYKGSSEHAKMYTVDFGARRH